MTERDKNDDDSDFNECVIVENLPSLSQKQISHIIIGESYGRSDSTQVRGPEKTIRTESEEMTDADGFTSVRRGKTRLVRSTSIEQQRESEKLSSGETGPIYEVSITSLKELPKPVLW